jgi:hypothetical protein
MAPYPHMKKATCRSRLLILGISVYVSALEGLLQLFEIFAMPSHHLSIPALSHVNEIVFSYIFCKVERHRERQF